MNISEGRMPDDRLTSPASPRNLAALIDAAGGDLERNGPVSPEELRQRLEALEAEWAGEGIVDDTTGCEADPRPR